MWELFWTFMIIGFVSFGGGYAMIPVIEHEVSVNKWMTKSEFMDAIAVAGMSPGPIAINTATYIGYHVANLKGAIVATLGMLMPSLMIMILISSLLYKIFHHEIVKYVFYGLRPVITALILFAAMIMAKNTTFFSSFTLDFVVNLFIFVMALYLLIRKQKHPLLIIILSGLVGMAYYG
ncbi:chromate transporter [Chengkuizengella axinellae]|uniref:Chromate transporter n=1 Tax=Chengkuizengella axinellae TaxID=3064388 RepID=A0ABT9IY78_9BACL|nr:chromate transporter [Chengkuizengella sp. 2205SS18-9]MDP5274313.1 chromate transporter [Chengkuizengella sp. 2205SS18-9]